MAEKKKKSEQKSEKKQSKENGDSRNNQTPPEYEFKKLQRSRADRVIAGICGGLGEYFTVDPTIIRVLTVVAGVITGGGIVLAYLIGWMFIPEKEGEEKKGTSQGGPILGIICGTILVLWGFGMLFDRMRYSIWVPGWIQPVFSWQSLFAVALVAAGVFLIVNLAKKGEMPLISLPKKKSGTGSAPVDTAEKRRLYRSVTNKKLSGVCGGLGEYFQIDPTVVRIFWIVGTIVTQILPGIIAYIVMAFVVPEKTEPQENTS